MFTYREHSPSAPLAPFVRCYWTLRGNAAPAQERILPDGCFELIFHFAAPFQSNGIDQPCAIFVGEVRRPTLLTTSASADVLGVRFRVGGAAPFLRHGLSACRDQMLHAAEVFTEWERVLEAAPGNRVAALERLLLQSFDLNRYTPAARAVAQTIDAHDGNIRIRDAASICGFSERAIERAFAQCVGITAKTYARIVRLQSFLARPDDDHGYFDDAHLAHDFRTFAGISLREFRDEQNAMNAAFSAAR